MTRWLTVAEAAEYSKSHQETVRDALRAGELKGVQRVKNSPWKTTEGWLDAWMGVEIELEVAA